MELYGGCFGELGIPVGFVSGEEIAVDQVVKAMPWVKTVIIKKEKETYTAGEQSINYIVNGRKLLRERAAEAVRSASDMKPLLFRGPLRFEAVYSSTENAIRYNTWGYKRNDHVVEWESPTMLDGLHTVNKLSWFPKKIYPFLPFLMFLFRRYYQIKNNYFPPQCNYEDATDPRVLESRR